MENWREDAQPEWPDAASAARGFPATTADGRATQAFPETGRTDVRRARPGTADTEFLRGRARRFSDAAETQVLPSAGGTQGFPQAGRAAADTEILPADGGTRAFPEPGAGRTAAVRDPWQEGGESAEHTHDPHEVTVQLDAVQLGEGLLRAVGGQSVGPEGSDGPVFVDESGRRSRTFRRIGIAVGAACAIYAAVIVVTLLSGNSKAPWLPVPGQEGRPAGQVDSPPLPAESAPPSGPGSTAPGSTLSPTDGTSPAPGVSATAPGAATVPDAPGTDADPQPTPTRTTRNPGTDVTLPGVSEPTDSPTTEGPTDTPAAEEPTAGPTETTGADDSGGTGTGTVADGPGTGTVADSPDDGTAVAAGPV